MSYFVYILRCSDNTFYTGITNDLDLRIKKHNEKKGSKYTATRTPVELLYYEPAESKSAALKREICIKKLSRNEKISLVTEMKEKNVNL